MAEYDGLEEALGDLHGVLVSSRESVTKFCSFLDIANGLVGLVQRCETLMEPDSDNSKYLNIRNESLIYLRRYLGLLKDFPEFAQQECSVQAKYSSGKVYVNEQYLRLRGKPVQE